MTLSAIRSEQLAFWLLLVVAVPDTLFQDPERRSWDSKLQTSNTCSQKHLCAGRSIDGVDSFYCSHIHCPISFQWPFVSIQLVIEQRCYIPLLPLKPSGLLPGEAVLLSFRLLRAHFPSNRWSNDLQWWHKFAALRQRSHWLGRRMYAGNAARRHIGWLW